LKENALRQQQEMLQAQQNGNTLVGSHFKRSSIGPNLPPNQKIIVNTGNQMREAPLSVSNRLQQPLSDSVGQ
jgi:hypothetical protein